MVVVKLCFLFLVLLLPVTGFTQFKCNGSSASCNNPNDQACRFTSYVWNKIKDKEDVWASHLITDFISPTIVNYRSLKKYCQFINYKGQVEGQVAVVVQEDTPEQKLFQVVHTACGRSGVLIENWKVQGSSLPPLNKETIIYSLQRKFDLQTNETYKSILLESKINEFSSYPSNPIPFEPFRAEGIFNYVTQRLPVVNNDGSEKTKIKSYLWVFDKQLLSQTIGPAEKSTQLVFHSPQLPFYNYGHRVYLRFKNGASACRSETVNISFDQYLKILPNRSNNTFGLHPDEYIKDCLGKELTYYRDELVKILEHHLDKYYPKFSTENVNANAVLQKNIKDILNFVNSGQTVKAVELITKLLNDVKSGSIKDER